jgi:sulfur-oxidizing protein SoxX
MRLGIPMQSAAVLLLAFACAGAAMPGGAAPGIPAPLSDGAGDAARGRAIVANRQLGLCLLCHTAPIPEERFQGNLAPDLAGAGDRWSAPELRRRMVDASRLNPETIMPAYYKTDGLTRVSAVLQGKPILTAQQIEDVVAYLQTLRTQ